MSQKLIGTREATRQTPAYTYKYQVDFPPRFASSAFCPPASAVVYTLFTTVWPERGSELSSSQGLSKERRGGLTRERDRCRNVSPGLFVIT